MPDPPPVSYSDKVGYKDNVDDIEALASKALSPISDFPPGADYDDDHSISSDDDDDDMSLSDEEGQRDATALRKKTSDILNDFEGFVKDVNKSSSASMEIMNTLTGTSNVRGADTVKSRITSGGGDAALNREWSHEERNLHDVRFGSDDDDYSSGGGYNKYEKRRFFKYAIPFFHSKKFKAIATGVAAVLILVVVVGTMGKAGDREDVGELNSVVMVEDVATVSIDTSTCEDHPTAKITPDGHTCEDFIAHVGRVNLHNARCSHLTTLTNEKGVPLFVKDVCRLSCGVCGDAWTAGEQKQEDAGLPQDQAEIVEPAIQQSTPVTLDNDSSSPVTECKDDLTKVVAIGGKTCETYFSDLTMEHLMELRCSHQTDIKSDLGNNFLLVKEICKQTCGLCSVTGQIMDESSTETQTEENSVESPASFTIEPEASSTVSIDSSACADDPTAIITTDGHTCEDFIAHVGRVPLHNARCSHESPVKNERGETLLVKEVCRLSCGMCGDVWTATEGQQKQEDTGMPQAQTEENGVSSGAFATETEAPKPEPSSTISIDESTCADNPTEIITTDGHTCEDFIAHVGRVPLHNARCSHESPVKNEKGEPLLVKEVCRLSCGMCGDAWTATEGAKEDTGVPQAQTEGNGISSGAAVTGTEAPKPEPSATVSIDSSTCADDPTEIITTDGHTCEDFIAHVGRVPLHNARCSHESPVKNEKGESMLVKEVCRLSCGMCGDVWTATEGQKEDTGMPQAQTEVLEPSIQEFTVQESHDEMTNWMTPVTLNNEPEPSATVSIDSSTCADDPTAIITTDGHTCEDFIAHVGRVPLHNARCSHESPVKNERGEPMLVKEVCRLSCGMCGDAWTATEGTQVDSGKPPVQEPVESVPPPSSAIVQVESETTEDTVSNTNNLSIQSKPASVSGAPEQQAYNYVANRYAPLWFDRSSGWEGTTYEAAVQFCLSLQQNRILCPYEAYCPMGPNSEVPFGGFRDGNSWVPAINSSEGWIRVGNSENTCKHAKFGDDWGQDGSNEEQTRNIMCCLYEKPEG